MLVDIYSISTIYLQCTTGVDKSNLLVTTPYPIHIHTNPMYGSGFLIVISMLVSIMYCTHSNEKKLVYPVAHPDHMPLLQASNLRVSLNPFLLVKI